jgi:hypothetical protein
MPVNKGNNHALDCAVIRFINQSNNDSGKLPYDWVRCAFSGDAEAYPGTQIRTRLHMQICVLNPACIKGYFLPRPVFDFNPFLKASEAG